MAEFIIKTIRFKRGTSASWSRVNPVLLEGEPGFEKDTNKIKIGDGSTQWNDLPYLNGNFTISADGKSITINNDSIGLYGYNEAQLGQIPSKGENNLEWIDPAQPISEEEIIGICTITGKE